MRRLGVVLLLLSHLLAMTAAGAGEVSADPAGAIYQEELNLTGNEPGGIVDYDLLQKTYHKIDEHALDAPAETEESLDSLARYLAGPAKNDQERARGIYRWIAANVEYDLEGSKAAARKVQTPEEVLAERKGVCSEYSALFSKLCELSGLEAVVISGRGKGYGYSVGSKIPEEANHAWNAVKIDGKWQLIDATWGAGHLDPEEGYVQSFEEFYFFTPPEDLVWTHLPQDPSWQLLERPISREEFQGMVYAKPAFFKNEMRIESPIEGIIYADEGVNFTLSAPQDIAIIAELLDEEGRKLPQRFTMVRRSSDEVFVRAACPGPGNCTLRIYSKRGDGEDQKAYDWTLDFRLVAGPKAQVQPGFPVIWDWFWELGLDVDSHPQGLIDAGSKLKVNLSAPKDILLLARLLDGEEQELPQDRTMAQREDEGYVIRASFPKPGNYTLRIYAKRADEAGGEYTSVIEYAVLARAGIEGATYPRTFGTFAEVGARLLRPLEGKLVTGLATDFKILIPGAEEVAVINGGSWTALSKEGEIFRGEANLSRGKAQVAASFPGEKSYHSLIEYDVL